MASQVGQLRDDKRTSSGGTRSHIVCCCSGVCTGRSQGAGGLRPHVKASQVAVASSSPSPSRTKTYEIEVRNLSYKIVKREEPPNGMLQSMKADIEQYRSKAGHYVLKHITCEARPGEMLAVAGPSGAGKSTLLEMLAGRIRPSSPSSSILVNGKPMDMQHFRRISGYVMQDDALFPMLTVKETLLYSARLRLPSTVPMTEKLARVDALMAELGLDHVATSKIGNETIRGLSGGERRRVSIGVDVIHDPAVLILDEPTSGLDSAAALQVVGMLRTMAVTHARTIILSIHQPGYRILQLIHSILLLAQGAVVHHGSLELLTARLAAAGHRIPPQVNVLEYAIDAIDALESDRSGIFSVKGKTNVPVLSLQELFELDPTRAPDVEKGCPSPLITRLESQEEDKVMFANSNVKEIMILAERFSRNIFRTKQLFTARTVQAVIAGLGLGSIYWRMGFGSRGARERVGFLAFSLTFLLTSSIEALPIFLEEKQILTRETSRGAYRISSYVVSSTIVFVPFLFLLAILYTTPVYFLVGLAPHYGSFFFFLLVIWLTVVMANSFVAFFSALVSNFIVGNTLITGFMGAFFLFSGYFISKDYMPKFWLGLHYTSLFKYPLDALLINEYSYVRDKCFGPVYGGHCLLTGHDVLVEAGLDRENKWTDVGIIAGFAVFYRILVFVVLRYKLMKRRR